MQFSCQPLGSARRETCRRYEVEVNRILITHKNKTVPLQSPFIEASDEEQLSFATAEGRAMVTRNRDDFITLTVQFFEALKQHKGLIIVPHTIPGPEFSKLAALLVKFSKDHPQGLESYTIEFLDKK